MVFVFFVRGVPTMRQTVFQILAVALVVLVGFLALFKRDAVMGLFRSGYAAARGFTPAQTPTECVDRFRDAIKARDYDTAATYCTGDYAEQMKKGAKAASALAAAIDSYLAQVEKRDYSSETAKFIVSYLEPYPSDFKYDLKPKGEDRAYVLIDPDNKILQGQDAAGWRGTLDPRIMRTLDPAREFMLANLPTKPVELQLTTDGKEKSWKLNFEVTAPLRLSVEFLNGHYKDYVKTMEKLRSEVMYDPMTKVDMEQHLRTELQTLYNLEKK
jgi:hypothetical protein